jgi:hypothetical protein
MQHFCPFAEKLVQPHGRMLRHCRFMPHFVPVLRLPRYCASESTLDPQEGVENL